VLGAGAVALLASGCAISDLPSQLGMPKPVTKQGEITYSLWQGTWVAGWVVFGFVLVLIVGTAIWFRKRADHLPAQTRYNIPIEVMYTVTPLIVVGVLTLFTWRDESNIMHLSDDQAVTVNVVGYQWNWGFNYVNEDVYTTGTPQQIPTLVLPVNEKIRFELTSPDVAHSFWVPDFLFKMDVIPGRINQFEITPTKEGHFAGRCAELCGTYHSQMLFYVDVVSDTDYQAYIQGLRDKGQTGQLDTGRANHDSQDQGRTEIGGSVDGYVTNGGTP
jgi:cytochrome c oxidase subunit 2